MSRRVFVILLACVPSGVLADPPDGEALDLDPACTGVLDGHAVDALTHEPVPGATVQINDRIVAETDSSGHFLVRGLCFGEAVVTVARPDYLPGQRTIVIDGRESLELELVLAGEMIEIREQAPDPPELRSTTTLAGEALERTRGQPLAKAVAAVPGVAELRAATGVGKPIVRGQFGRRLLLLVDGVRHRAQEWGLDHAPEIDPFAADAIRIVRGAGGVRFGSDAIGGAILVEPPEPPREPGARGEAHVIGASNGRGGTIAGRLQAAFERVRGLAMQLEGSGKRLAAAETPSYALANTGVREWTAGATLWYRRPTSAYKLSYRRYRADLGVCACLRIDTIDDFLAQAAAGEPVGADQLRAELAIARPYQEVAHDLAIARARWEADSVGTVTATYAFQHDLRREYDVVRQAVTGAQFNFRLMTHETEVVFEHNPIHLSEHWHLRGAAGATAMAQIHHYGGLQLVPDHRALAAGVYASERLVGHATDVELGARYDLLARRADLERIDYLRLVRSGQLAMDACPGDDPVACSSRFHTFTASLGVVRRFGAAWSIKGELSTAGRAPTSDEQYLNGTAPTFPVLGLGKPDVRPETTWGTSATLGYDGTRVKGEVSAFANLFDDYIYFAPAIGPDGKPIFDVLVRGTFPRFTTQTRDAMFWGADGGVAVSPHRALELTAQASLVRARATDNSYLVFVPADRFRGTVTAKPPDAWPTRDSFVSVTGTYVARQRRFDRAQDFIDPPPGYFVLGAAIGTESCIADQTVRFALEGENLTNSRYRDYTSLMRYFADEPGWQVWLRASVFFDPDRKGTDP